MHFEQSEKSRLWMARVQAFMDDHVYPNLHAYEKQTREVDRWTEIPPLFEELKAKAKAQGLWNLFMPPSDHDDEFFTSVGLTSLE
jgi:acyl-CoA dehydrogenase